MTGSTISGRSVSGTSSNMRLSAGRTSLSTVLEQDFTVLGKKSSLLCPFAKPKTNMENFQEVLKPDRFLTPSDTKDPTPHQSGDPICAAMYAETMASPTPSVTGSLAKCPIRYMDQHSPEEVARYFETHKHEIPRSHEVCVKRYQRNEDDIKKLDAKYGNLVSMIQGLGQKHQPMLPAPDEDEGSELDRRSDERVENWANAVSVDSKGHDPEQPVEDEEDRESRFDRPLKEIRVGESPSRPWGISVPILDPPDELRPVSPPPAPVSAEHMPKPVGKCPFGHGQQTQEEVHASEPELKKTEWPAGKCPFGHGQETKAEDQPPKPQTPPLLQTQPLFIHPPQATMMGGGNSPQMVFNGPVFIGYPMEQALAFMQQYHKGTQ